MDWSFGPKKSLGIDIGAFSIKVVELSSSGKKKKLENYLEFFLPSGESQFHTFSEDNLLLLSDEVAELLNGLLERAGIKQKKAAFSLPDFSTFITHFYLPPMNESEIPQAVQFEARHHIPLPLSDVTFDWQIIKGEKGARMPKSRVLLVAVPNKVLSNYQRLASLCGLEVKGIEAEVFGLSRAVVPSDKQGRPVCLVDFGWRSTTVSIADRGVLKMSHSFDFSGTRLTAFLARELGTSLEKAENIKKEKGIASKKEKASQSLLNRMHPLVLEIQKVCRNFYQIENREVKDIILAGGTSWLPGLVDYLTEKTETETAIADPFSSFNYNSVLEGRLREIGPSFAVAVGVGLMGVQA